MKISINGLRGLNSRYGSVRDPASEGIDNLIEKIGAQLGGVEEVIQNGKKYDGVVIVRVISCEQHPNANRLHICLIDDGGVVPDVARNENGLVQVVCGAPNVREGLTVAWLPPGATVPSSFGSEPFVLEARELRGVVSNGMLASPKELALGDSHDGILVIDDDVTPGTLFAEKYGLKDDVIIDIENKMFTHRPDCFGWVGIARELEGIQGRPYKSPQWYRADIEMPALEAQELPLEVRNKIPQLVPRFTAITMSEVTVKPSPVWLQVELSRVGIRPINNIVDYTNFFMMETGQPLHIYDYDKVLAQDSGAEKAILIIRHPGESEKIRLLNGKEIEPRTEAIMIATQDALIGIGGVMGGADTEVDATTRNIIIEAANFDMYSIRRTAMAHGLFTDAVTRFTKGQSPLQTAAVLAKIVDEIRRYAGGKVASTVIDDNHLSDDIRERNSLYPDVPVSADFVNARLGLKLSPEEMSRLLTNVEFSVRTEGENLVIRAPFWRTDIEIAEDIVEEVGGLYGLDKLTLELPQRSIAPAAKDTLLETKSRIRNALARAGANELLTYSFVHGNLLDKVGQDRSKAYKLSNALSPELQYYRMSLTPSLLDKVHANIKAGYDEFALFEIGKAHMKEYTDLSESSLPREMHSLSFLYSAKSTKDGAPYYAARKYLQVLLASENVESLVVLEPLEHADFTGTWVEQMITPFEPTRAAIFRDKDRRIRGVVGEYKASVRKALKLPAHTAGFEIDVTLFIQNITTPTYVPLPRFPKVTQDITLKVSSDVLFQNVYDVAWDSLGAVEASSLLIRLSPLDIYQSSEDTTHKQISLRLEVASYEKTMTDTEVTALLDKVASAAHEQLGAERI